MIKKDDKGKTITKKTTITKKVTVTKTTAGENKKPEISAMRLMSTTKHQIPKEDGAEMITNLQNIVANASLPFVLNHAYDFDKSIFDVILSDADCTGIRFYFGLNAENALCLVFNGVSDETDLYIPLADGQSAVADMGQGIPLGTGKRLSSKK